MNSMSLEIDVAVASLHMHCYMLLFGCMLDVVICCCLTVCCKCILICCCCFSVCSCLVEHALLYAVV